MKPVVKTKPVFTNMSDFQPGTRVNMNLRVVSVKIIRERKRYDGGKMMAFDEQLDIVKEGQAITIRNAHANVVKEHVRLEVDRWAKVEASKEAVSTSVNTSKNYSDIEYELVTK